MPTALITLPWSHVPRRMYSRRPLTQRGTSPTHTAGAFWSLVHFCQTPLLSLVHCAHQAADNHDLALTSARKLNSSAKGKAWAAVLSSRACTPHTPARAAVSVCVASAAAAVQGVRRRARQQRPCRATLTHRHGTGRRVCAGNDRRHGVRDGGPEAAAGHQGSRPGRAHQALRRWGSRERRSAAVAVRRGGVGGMPAPHAESEGSVTMGYPPACHLLPGVGERAVAKHSVVAIRHGNQAWNLDCPLLFCAHFQVRRSRPSPHQQLLTVCRTTPRRRSTSPPQALQWQPSGLHCG